MKKLIVPALLICLSLSACSIDGNVSDNLKTPNYPENTTKKESTSVTTKNEVEISETSETNEYPESDMLFESFMQLVEEDAKAHELVAYIDRYIDKVTKDKADIMLLVLEEVLVVHESYYQGKFFNNEYTLELNNASQNGLDGKIVDKIKNTELKALLSEVFKSGYKLISREGSVYPIIDYRFLSNYNQFLSTYTAEYMGIMAVESDKPVAADAALIISWDELAERLLKIELFLEKNDDFIRNEDLEYMYFNYLKMYLAGLDNTPAYDYKTKKYKDEVINSFEKFIKENMESQSAEIVKSYLDILKANDFSFTDNVTNFSYLHVNFKSAFRYNYVNQNLTKLMPDKIGFTWIYNGFAEYGHIMTIEDIIKENEQIQYIIKGEVEDASDGESGEGKDFYNLDIIYIIDNATIIQIKSENIMMDSEMDRLELIKAPLQKGNSWLQIAIDKNGNERYLNCEITAVNEVGNSKVYTVEYKDQDSDYYEVRMIEEGLGVVSFTKLWMSPEGNFEIGYGLYKEASGYQLIN